jgi:hypothetical protein
MDKQEREPSAGRTVTIEGFVYELDLGLGFDSKSYHLFASDRMGDQDYALIGPAEFTYTIPETFNPTASKIAALEKTKAAMKAEFSRRVAELDEQITKLQAIEYTPAEVQ